MAKMITIRYLCHDIEFTECVAHYDVPKAIQNIEKKFNYVTDEEIEKSLRKYGSPFGRIRARIEKHLDKRENRVC